MTHMSGYFIAYQKSEFIPSQQLYYLGFDFDSHLETVSIPIEKYNKTCARIHKFLNDPDDYFELKELQRIRVPLNYKNFRKFYKIKNLRKS